jgi:hypothetical protein
MNFFAVLLQSRPFQPISTLLIKIVYSLISAEPEPNEDDKKRLDWIYDNTHKKVNEPLSIIELAVFKNLDRGLNRELDISDKTFTLTELYSYLDEVALELSGIVINIAKRYSIDIPIQALGSMQQSQQTIQF